MGQEDRVQVLAGAEKQRTTRRIWTALIKEDRVLEGMRARRSTRSGRRRSKTRRVKRRRRKGA